MAPLFMVRLILESIIYDYMALYHLDNFQMGLLGNAYGLLGFFSYALGEYLADKC
ncbi:hypothetical protein OLO84_01885 [Campylobacter jejuni]|nr:hypothetical protein [Campylobacter jejuni]